MTWWSAKWRQRLRWSELILIFALLTACLALAMSYFLRSYYGQHDKSYQPFDIQREQQVQKPKPGP